jgi:hypothetical protein
MLQEDQMARAEAVQRKYTDELMRKKNVQGVAVGLARNNDTPTNEIALVVLVNRKVPWEQLAPEDRIPRELDGVRVDVQEVGDLRAF